MDGNKREHQGWGDSCLTESIRFLLKANEGESMGGHLIRYQEWGIFAKLTQPDSC